VPVNSGAKPELPVGGHNTQFALLPEPDEGAALPVDEAPALVPVPELPDRLADAAPPPVAPVDAAAPVEAAAPVDVAEPVDAAAPVDPAVLLPAAGAAVAPAVGAAFVADGWTGDAITPLEDGDSGGTIAPPAAG
jgi:hypothetical protein